MQFQIVVYEQGWLHEKCLVREKWTVEWSVEERRIWLLHFLGGTEDEGKG